MKIVFTRRFAMAHRLLTDRRSKCVTPHGHNEFVKVTLGTDAPLDFGNANMAASFEDLKRSWHRFIDTSVDHAFQLNAKDPLIDYFRTHEPDILPRLMVIAGDPTTEALCLAFFHKITAFLTAENSVFSCLSVEIEETPTNTVSLDAQSFERLKALVPGEWCLRADMTINDLLPAGVIPMTTPRTACEG